MHNYLEVFFISFFTAVILTPLARQIAFRFNILDYPKSHGIHSAPVPRIGGVAIYAAFVIGVLSQMELSEQLKGVLLGSSVIFVVGFIDDVYGLRARFRLLIQAVMLCVMMFRYGVMIDVFPWVLLNAGFTALGILGITNAVNFLDNMDGLSSGLVATSSIFIFSVAYMTNQLWLGFLAVALVASCCGFLVFNFRKAHVFMGDSGSTFLGFTLASLTVMADWSSHSMVTVAVPVLILGVPIIDMTLITLLRYYEDKVSDLKEWIDYTGKDHLSHRVMRLGLGPKGTVFTLWSVQAIFGFVALAVFPRGPMAGAAGFVFFTVIALGTIFFFRKRKRIVSDFYRNILKRPRRIDIPAESESEQVLINN